MNKICIAIAICILGSFSFAETGAKKMSSITQKQSGPNIQYVVFHKPGPKWQPGVDFREQIGVGEHVAHYMKLNEKGSLLIGGPFLDNTGGMMVAKGETLESITKFAESDPAVKSGLLVIEIKPWLIAMENSK